MRISALARRLGTTAHAIRFYERRGVLPPAPREDNRYRDYTEADTERLRLVLGLRQLDLPLEQAASLAAMCAEGRCDEVSEDLREAITDKRRDIAHRIRELRYLERRLAHLAGGLADGGPLRQLIALGKEERDGSSP